MGHYFTAMGNITLRSDTPQEVLDFIIASKDAPDFYIPLLGDVSHPFFSDTRKYDLFMWSREENPCLAREFSLTTQDDGNHLLRFVSMSKTTIETYELFLDWLKPWVIESNPKVPLIGVQPDDDEYDSNGPSYWWSELFLVDRVTHKVNKKSRDVMWYNEPWDSFN